MTQVSETLHNYIYCSIPLSAHGPPDQDGLSTLLAVGFGVIQSSAQPLRLHVGACKGTGEAHHGEGKQVTIYHTGN